jgi:hypothetical protein
MGLETIRGDDVITVVSSTIGDGADVDAIRSATRGTRARGGPAALARFRAPVPANSHVGAGMERV